ncbi:hypothetical protein ACWEK5_17970 [Rhodococcus koreensis]
MTVKSAFASFRNDRHHAWRTRGITGLPAVQALGDTIGKPRQLVAGRAYKYVTNDTSALPVWRLGYTTCMRFSARNTLRTRE